MLNKQFSLKFSNNALQNGQFAALTTTAIYLRMSGQEAKEILREKGLI